MVFIYYVAYYKCTNLHRRYPEHANVKQTIRYKPCEVICQEIKVESYNTVEKQGQLRNIERIIYTVAQR